MLCHSLCCLIQHHDCLNAVLWNGKETDRNDCTGSVWWCLLVNIITIHTTTPTSCLSDTGDIWFHEVQLSKRQSVGRCGQQSASVQLLQLTVQENNINSNINNNNDINITCEYIYTTTDHKPTAHTHNIVIIKTTQKPTT